MFSGFLFGTLSSNCQYNAYMVDQLTANEVVLLSEVVAPGTVIRMGGEEYEHSDYDVSRVLDFVALIDGRVSYMAGDHNPVTKYGEFGDYALSEVTYRNEQWNDIETWSWIRRDFWTYLFNRQTYYRKHADRHVREADSYLGEMLDAGHDVTLIINVPLPQNKYLSAYLDQIATHQSIDKVSIHVYGKWLEADYLDKLDFWLDTVTGYGWEVMVGEMSGLFNHKEGRELKNSDTHKTMHNEIMAKLYKYDITEVYFFTLCASAESLKWTNPPIYHRYQLGDIVTDELSNIFE